LARNANALAGPKPKGCAYSVALKPNSKTMVFNFMTCNLFSSSWILDGYELARASAASMRLFANSLQPRPPGYITFSLVLVISNQRALSRPDQKVFRKERQ
ncbi:hypothetical protein TWF106_011409, partial [Orbilia oligospora]